MQKLVGGEGWEQCISKCKKKMSPYDYFVETDSNTLIIRLVIGISSYWQLFQVSVSLISERCNRYHNKVSNNIISFDYNIINCLYDSQVLKNC